MLLPLPRQRPLAMLIAAALVLFFAGTTRLRATEWSNPLVFAETEAAKHPDSPRATYDLARSLIIAGRYDRSSPFTLRAQPAVERALRAPGSDALPYQAALMLAARTGAPFQRAWWQGLQAKLRAHPGKPENQLALIALSDCALGKLCAFPPDDMIETFQAALEPGDQPVILGAFGSYALGVMGDPEFALRLWRESTRIDPNNSRIQKDATRLEIAQGHYAQAAERIESLRRRGRFGQNRDLADSLLVELNRARARRPESFR
jgi:tetratricopeptide (TPR) repeat protein